MPGTKRILCDRCFELKPFLGLWIRKLEFYGVSSEGIVVSPQGRYGTGARKVVCRSAGPYHANVAVVQDKSSDRQIWAVASQTSPEAAAAMGRNGEMTKWMKPSVVVWKRWGCPFAQHTAGEKRRKRVWLG